MAWIRFKACRQCGGDLALDEGDWLCLQCGRYYYTRLRASVALQRDGWHQLPGQKTEKALAVSGAAGWRGGFQALALRHGAAR